jgi:hypothetical protein
MLSFVLQLQSDIPNNTLNNNTPLLRIALLLCSPPSASFESIAQNEGELKMEREIFK